jgi:hypothetical protein
MGFKLVQRVSMECYVNMGMNSESNFNALRGCKREREREREINDQITYKLTDGI